MDERESKEGVFKTDWLTIPKGTGFFTGPPPVGEPIREAEESQKIQYYPRLTKPPVEGILWHFSIDREWFPQESRALGEGNKKRFLNRFLTPIGLAKGKVGIK